jgi:hypothetical protein
MQGRDKTSQNAQEGCFLILFPETQNQETCLYDLPIGRKGHVRLGTSFSFLKMFP